MVSCHLSPVTCHFILNRFWKGGESLLARARRGKSEHQRARCRVTRACLAGIHAGGRSKDFSTDSATENQTAEIVAALCERRKKCDGYRPPLQLARVKRCGKSAPLEAQATRHGKPHRVQGQIGNPGAARSRFRESGTDSGYRLHRQMVLSPRKRADRIRLTALPKPFPIPKSEGRVTRVPLQVGRVTPCAPGHNFKEAARRGLTRPTRHEINSKSLCFSRYAPAGSS